MENQRIIMAGIAGGSVAAFLNATPFLNLINCFCCIGILLGGAAGLFYYDRLVRDQEYITTATAVPVGLTCGSYGYMWTSVFFRNILILPIFCLAGSLLMRIYLIKNRTF